MRKLLTSILVVCFALVFTVSFAFAEEVKAAGTLKAVDAAKGTVVVTVAKEDVTIKATKDQVGTLKAGDKVKVTYDKGAKENTAKGKITKDRGAKVPAGC